MRVRKSPRKIGGMIAALGLLVAACGGSDAASLPTTEPASETVEQAEVASETETAETPAADGGSCTAPEQTGPTLDVGIVAQFDTEAGQNADGLTFDSAGNAYVSFAPLGEVARLSGDGSPPEVLGTIPGWDDPFPGIGGIIFGTDGNLYAAVAGSADTTGVWVFECGNGEPTRISGTEAMGFPNDLVFDDAGNLFVSDLHTSLAEGQALGAVWRISPDGDIGVWAEDVLLGGTNSFGIGYLGANGLAIGDDRIYVAVTEKSSIVEIMVADDGEAGPITVLAESEQLIFVEDVAVGSTGNVFAVEAATNSLVAIDADGSITTVAAVPEGNIDQPANVLLAPGSSGDELVFVSNNARFSEQVDGAGPSVVAIEPGL